MSINAFMFHGTHSGYLGKCPIPAYASVGDGHIHFYDIGEDDSIGALYPDNARMIHPLSITEKFRPYIVEALKENRLAARRSPRPRIKKARPKIHRPTTAASARPRVILKSSRPKLKARD